MTRPDATARLAANRPKDGPSKVLIGAVVAAVLIVALVVVVIVNAERGKLNAAHPQVALANGGGIVVSGDNVKAGAPAVDVWEDFQCPACRDMEKASGAEYVKMAKAGDIKLTVHMMSFLDNNLGNDASLRASAASVCAAAVNKFPEYHSAVYANQPPEGTGYTDAKLAQLGDVAGITGKDKAIFNTCLASKKYVDYAKAIQVSADKAGIKSSPTVQINGKTVDDKQLNLLFSGPAGVQQVFAAATK